MELVLTLKWPWITHLDLDLSVSHVSWFQHTLPLMLDSEYVFHWGIGPFCRAAVLSLLGTKASIMEDNFLFLTNRTRGMVWEGFKHIYGSCSCDKSNVAAHQKGGGAQVVRRVKRSSRQYRWSLAHSPAVHPLWCNPVPNKYMWYWPGVWGPLR